MIEFFKRFHPDDETSLVFRDVTDEDHEELPIVSVIEDEYFNAVIVRVRENLSFYYVADVGIRAKKLYEVLQLDELTPANLRGHGWQLCAVEAELTSRVIVRNFLVFGEPAVHKFNRHVVRNAFINLGMQPPFPAEGNAQIRNAQIAQGAALEDMVDEIMNRGFIAPRPEIIFDEVGDNPADEEFEHELEAHAAEEAFKLELEAQAEEDED